MRTDGRLADEVRNIRFTRDYTRYAEGAVLVEMGETRVLCSAMVEGKVPPHCAAEGKGWVTAEYCMLPSSTADRKSLQGKVGGRAFEIQRLIGRSLRAAVDLHGLQGITIWVDCTVIQADGGTRTASITGGFVALVDALWKLRDGGKVKNVPLLNGIAALSVGVVDGRTLVDLCAEEDKAASVDMNVVMTHDGRLIEVQGTAETEPFTPDQHADMMRLVAAGINKVKAAQIAALGDGLKL